MARKLCIIILFHFWLITFGFHSWFSGLVNVTMGPQAMYIQLWRHQITPNNSRNNSQTIFQTDWHIVSGNLNILEIEMFRRMDKLGTDRSWRSDLQISKNLEYGSNSYRKAWNGNDWQTWKGTNTFQTNMKLEFLKILDAGPIFFRKHELGIW